MTSASRTRSSLGRLLGALIIGVIILAGTGLFAIQYHQQRASDAVAQLLESSRRLDLARTAQVDFKVQVQEWKNLLLRGQSAAALPELTARFTKQEETVRSELDALAAAPGLSTTQRQEAAALIAEHERLGGLYRTALAAYVPGDAATVFAVDAAVRGIDRELNQRIDGLAEQILTDSRTQADALRERGTREYDTLRSVVSAVATAVIVLSALLAWLAMRSGDPAQTRPA